MAEPLHPLRKFGVDPPAPPYTGFPDQINGDIEKQGWPISLYATDQDFPPHDGCEAYDVGQRSVIEEDQKQQERPPQADAPELSATGFYLNKRNGWIFAFVIAFLSAGLISGWVTAIIFAERLAHPAAPAVQNITMTATATSMQPTTITRPASTTTQTALITATPTALSNSTVYGCRQLLNQICRDIAAVPVVVSGPGSGTFGDCEPVFRYFYCELMFDLANTPEAVGAQPKEVLGSWPGVAALECVGLRPYCVNFGEATAFEGSLVGAAGNSSA